MNIFEVDRRVEFCETDAAGIVHFSSLCQYMEQAEHAFLRSLGHSVFPQPKDSSKKENDLLVTWPRVRLELDFASPAHFEEVLRLKVSIARLGESSITYRVQMDGPHGAIATGKSTSVCCTVSSDGNGRKKLVKTRIPNELRVALEPFLESSSES